MALILPTSTPWGAFYAGVSLPSIVSGSLGKSSARSRAVPVALPSPKERISLREYLGLLFA